MRIFIILSLSTVALAQTAFNSGVLGGVISPTPVPSGVSMTSGPGWVFSPVSLRAVTGMPYSAEQVTEHVQTLADGTRITQPSQKVMLYRDSQGRTRTERTFAQPPGMASPGVVGPGIIEISDPVSGVRYNLDPRAHVARKMSSPTVAPPPPQPAPVQGSGCGLARSPNVLPAPSIAASAIQALRPQVSRESLGTQTFEGVLAEGSRTTMVFPIGTVGNDRPITTVSESWMSPELKMVVMSKTSDPRYGESSTRMSNISRAEPSPSLFEIPSDYQVVDMQAATAGR